MQLYSCSSYCTTTALAAQWLLLYSKQYGKAINSNHLIARCLGERKTVICRGAITSYLCLKTTVHSWLFGNHGKYYAISRDLNGLEKHTVERKRKIEEKKQTIIMHCSPPFFLKHFFSVFCVLSFFHCCWCCKLSLLCSRRSRRSISLDAVSRMLEWDPQVCQTWGLVDGCLLYSTAIEQKCGRQFGGMV